MKDFLYWKVVAVLNWFATRLLKKHHPKIVAITGSVGKTSTKRAIAAVVEQDFKTQWHDGNFNSEVGLPLALFEIDVPRSLMNPFSWLLVFIKMLAKLLSWPYPYELLVLELGIDKVGDMDRFLSYVHPDISVVTAVQGAHLGAGLHDLDTVYVEKTKLADAAPTKLINMDDYLLSKDYVRDNPTSKTYGTQDSDYQATDITTTKDGYMSFTINGHTITTKFIGEHSILSLIAGWAVGDMLGVHPDTATLALQELQPYPGRMNRFNGLRGSTILDDTYNNVSVESAKSAIDTLLAYPCTGKRYLILGTMNEMGDQTEAGHAEVGRHLAANPVDYLVTIGQPPKDFTVPVIGTKIKHIESFMSPYEAGHHVAPLLKKGDVVLVKGSQNGVFAEEATALLLNLESDRSKLVRQSARWQKIKHSQFNS